jgi:hypothetical protein
MAAAAGAWLLETMNECAYADHAIKELQELEARLAQNVASGADVYLLQNFAVLIDCALRDFGVYDSRRRQMNTTFDRNCMVVEGRAVELHKLVARMQSNVQTLTAAGGGADAVDTDQLRQRLGDVRDAVDGILGELGGRGSEHGKRPRPHAEMGRPQTARLSALLAQMRVGV